jgi:hypothetical protein
MADDGLVTVVRDGKSEEHQGQHRAQGWLKVAGIAVLSLISWFIIYEGVTALTSVVR